MAAGERLVRNLEWLGERQARASRTHRAEPIRVDVVRLEPGRFISLVGGIHEQIFGTLVPMLAELGASHSDDRDAVLDSSACHGKFSSPSAPRACLPEIVVNPVRGKEPAKRHFDFLANRDLGRLAVSHLAQEAAATIEVNYDVNSRRV